MKTTSFDHNENDNHGNVGVAFAMSIAAAVSTSLGAAIVLFPFILNMITRRKMAASFGFAGGIMLFISLVSLLPHAVQKIDLDQYEKNNAFLYGSLSFFFGASLPLIMNVIVTMLLNNTDDLSKESQNSYNGAKHEGKAPHMGNENTQIVPCCQQETDIEECKEIIQNDGEVGTSEAINAVEDDSFPSEGDFNEDSLDEEEQRQLHIVNIKLAVAFALHNLPEGIVTYSTASDEARLGALLSIAVALHNIPEGFCIALSAYLSSRNRTKAFLWGSLPGLLEPLGAVIGWAVLENAELSNTAEGIMDGVVAGIIAMICMKELFTSAHKYDPEDKVATLSTFVGMLVMTIGTFVSEIPFSQLQPI